MVRLLVLSELDFGDVFGRILPRLSEVSVQLIATIITLFIVYKLAWKPLRKFIKQRQDYIESNINDAAKSKELAQTNFEKSEEVLNQAYAEYKQTLDNAKLDAIKAREDIIDKAETEAKKQLETARQIIENEKVKAKAEIETEIVDVALVAAKKIIGREINEDDNKKIVKEFIEEIKA